MNRGVRWVPEPESGRCGKEKNLSKGLIIRPNTIDRSSTIAFYYTLHKRV